jgi:hypothetical protein
MGKFIKALAFFLVLAPLVWLMMKIIKEYSLTLGEVALFAVMSLVWSLILHLCKGSRGESERK